MHDPALSPLGQEQCARLQEHLKTTLPELTDRVGLIVVSPMRRTIETAQLSLDWLIKRGVPVVPMAEWQGVNNLTCAFQALAYTAEEYSDNLCDTGSEIDVLAREFPTLDFNDLHPEWPSKTGYFAYTKKDVLQRGGDCRTWLKARPEDVIVVVSHASFLRTSIGHAKFGNADYRIYDFEADGLSSDLVQWDLTEQRGGGMGNSMKGPRGVEPGDFPADVTTQPVQMSSL